MKILAIFLALPFWLSAESFRNSGYVRVGLGARPVSGADVSRQFDLGASGGLSPKAPDTWDSDLDLAVGYQSPSLVGFELGMGGGANGNADYSADLNAGYPGSERGYTEDISYGSFFAMPLVRVPMQGLFQRPSFHTLGLQLGYATLYGRITSYDSSGTATILDTNAASTSYAVCYRFEQMLGRRMNLGLELRYQWVSFEPSYNLGGRVQRLDGSPLELNLSGPSIKLSFGFWFIKPFLSEADKAADAARIAARAGRRLKRASRPIAVAETDDAVAARLVKKGDDLMAQAKYLLAVEIYKTAVDEDSASLKGWRGLGDAYLALGQEGEALRAYQKAFFLGGNDEILKGKIEQLKNNQLRKPGP